MENGLREWQVTCPWCWEQYVTWLESGIGDMELIEDCRICCHPIQLYLHTDVDGTMSLQTERAQ